MTARQPNPGAFAAGGAGLELFTVEPLMQVEVGHGSRGGKQRGIRLHIVRREPGITQWAGRPISRGPPTTQPAVFSGRPRGNPTSRTSIGEGMLGVYAGLGVSLLLALLFGRADRR